MTTVSPHEDPPFYVSQFWMDLREFCKRTGEDIAAVVRDMKFDVLDG